MYDHRSKHRCNIYVCKTLKRNFYVDDLNSDPDKETATKLLRDYIKSCAESKLRLTKFSSNNKNVILSVSVEEQRKSMKNQYINEELRSERTLEVNWVIGEDNLGFSFTEGQDAYQKKSTVYSLFTLKPSKIEETITPERKKIMQRLCLENLGLDDLLLTNGSV